MKNQQFSVENHSFFALLHPVGDVSPGSSNMSSQYASRRGCIPDRMQNLCIKSFSTERIIPDGMFMVVPSYLFHAL